MNRFYADYRRLHGGAIVALACVTLLLVLRSTMPATSAQSSLQAEVEQIVTRDIAPMAAADGAGGVAVAIRIEGGTYFFNYGLADVAAKRPITSDSLFNVGSIRKIFEAALIALGLEHGELTLEDRVAQYVTGLHGDYIKRVTIGQLATHTSGLVMPASLNRSPHEVIRWRSSSICSTTTSHRTARRRVSNKSIRTRDTYCCSLRSSVAMGVRLPN